MNASEHNWPDLDLADLIQKYGLERIVYCLFNFQDFEQIVNDQLVERDLRSRELLASEPWTKDNW